MGGSHDHGIGSAGAQHVRPLAIALALTAAVMIVELVVGLTVGSLALISDAAHMGTDVLGLGMGLAAVLVARRPAAPQRTFGFFRLEVLAALANGVLLFGVAGYVIVEAVLRFSEPPEVPGPPLLVTAVIGLSANVVSFLLLRRGARESLNLRGAALEVLGDLLGSVGVIAAAIVLWTTGWAAIDPIIGVAIGLFILPRTWRLTAQALRILLEVAPPGIAVDAVSSRIAEIDGIASVHDLHIWTITSGIESASGHVCLDGSRDYPDVLREVLAVLDDSGVRHATIQCEPVEFAEGDGLPV